MSEPIVVIDVSDVRRGKLEELGAAIGQLVEFVGANEPDALAYHVYFTEDHTRMTVVQVHPDSASMELHMKVAGPAFPKFADLLRLSSMDVYGTPSEHLLDLLRRKAELLGGATLAVHEPGAGFTRFG